MGVGVAERGHHVAAFGVNDIVGIDPGLAVPASESGDYAVIEFNPGIVQTFHLRHPFPLQPADGSGKNAAQPAYIVNDSSHFLRNSTDFAMRGERNLSSSTNGTSFR